MQILFVDAGNYSRSPAADVIAKTHQAQNPKLAGVVFSSAGLKDKHVGGGADPRTIEECGRRGYDLAAFRCRQIGAEDFQANRIYAMDRSNLEALVAMKPAASQARIELLLGDKEVPDPYFGGADGFVVAIDLIERRVQSLLDELAGSAV
ncbi:MAG: low molecular weight phosphotyrosine protein phosphatase [Parvularculaceae bacterium]|nr:low molecular weight phosphotyrosine protein phosphatase [Parvularculaceae bacterium]